MFAHLRRVDRGAGSAEGRVRQIREGVVRGQGGKHGHWLLNRATAQAPGVSRRIAVRRTVVLPVVAAWAISMSLVLGVVPAVADAQAPVPDTWGVVAQDDSDAGSGSGPAAAQAEGADLASVLHAYVDAYNSGDAAAAASNFTDNAVWVRPPATGPCSQQTPCVGRDAILRQEQAGGVANNQCLTIFPTAVAGSVVTATVEVRADSMRAAGVERILNVWLVQVAEDKIAALYVLNDLTDPQTTAWRAIQAGTQAPGEPIPSPSTPCGSA